MAAVTGRNAADQASRRTAAHNTGRHGPALDSAPAPARVTSLAEAVADPALGPDVAPRGGVVGFDLVAQVGDVRAQQRPVVHAVGPPDLAEQRTRAHRAATMVRQHGEQLELERREPHLAAVATDRVGREVDLERPYREDRLLGGVAHTAED